MMKVTIAPGTGRPSASVTRTVGLSAVCSPAIPTSPTLPLSTMFAGGPAFGDVLSLQESANVVTATARIADRFMADDVRSGRRECAYPNTVTMRTNAPAFEEALLGATGCGDGLHYKRRCRVFDRF